MRWVGALVLVTGCAPSPPSPIVGPFTGSSHRFVVDRLRMPISARDFAFDLNGDGRVDNHFADLLAFVEYSLSRPDERLQPGADAMVGAGVVGAVLEITSDDARLENDPTVGVRWIDAGSAAPLGGFLKNGSLATNSPLLQGHPPAEGRARLPAAALADPVELRLVGLHLTLKRDGDGFAGEVHGALAHEEVWTEGCRVLRQILGARPEENARTAGWLFDHSPRDGQITLNECKDQALLVNLFLPDLDLFDDSGVWAPSKERRKSESLSIGFGFHATPCPAGTCRADGPPSCINRLRDGDEADVDCGGSCRRCPGGSACLGPGDCRSGGCTGGRCDPPRCDDGVHNGFESDVDCGPSCPRCAEGKTCFGDLDCVAPLVCNWSSWQSSACGPKPPK